LHAAKDGESNAHWNVEFGSLELNWNCGLRLLVSPVGPAVIVVSGGSESTGSEEVVADHVSVPESQELSTRRNVPVAPCAESNAPETVSLGGVPGAVRVKA
jgi:hypothetical protein